MHIFSSSLLIAAPLLLAGTAHSQASLVRSNGAIGSSVDYAITGPAGDLFFLLPSLNSGPTPLALIDPGDPRVLEVGLDLLSLLQVGLLDGAGDAAVSLPLPEAPALQGLDFFAQAVTFSVGTGDFGPITNPTSFAIADEQTTALTVFGLGVLVAGHSLVELGDGGAVLAGGGATDLAGNPVSSLDLRAFDPQTQGFSVIAGAQLSHTRAGSTATRLLDGRVLYLGGTDEAGLVRNTGDLFDPVAGLVTATAPMNEPRFGHTATLLADGRVFVAGGLTFIDTADPLGSINSLTPGTELYDPATNTWSGGPNLPLPRAAHGASRLADGRVLLTGGIEVPSLFGIPLPGFSNDCRLYQPSNNSLSATGDFGGDRSLHSQITLADGRALLVGGAGGSILTQTITPLDSCWTFDAAAGNWTQVASLSTPRAFPNLHELPSGEILAIGGLATVDVVAVAGMSASGIESTDSSLGAWTLTTDLVVNRAAAVSLPVEGGARVLITGAPVDGAGMPIADDSAETYLP